MNHIDIKTHKGILTGLAGGVLLPVIWIIVRFAFHIPDRYLPSPVAV
jgi:ABC-type nitrate/sulfonate/bicarbonate transport system permease component